MTKHPPYGPRCKACHAPVAWRLTAAGKRTPDNLDGTSHWATCSALRESTMISRSDRARTKAQLARLQPTLPLEHISTKGQ